MRTALDAPALPALREHTDAVRLLHGEAGGVPGLVIEQFADVLIAQIHEGALTLTDEQTRRVCEIAMRARGARAVYRKVFPLDRSDVDAALHQRHCDPEPWIGEPAGAEIVVRERGLRFLVRPYDGYATGLYLDHRDTRGELERVCRGLRVLNLFAYTCASSVAAAGGGAAETTSVDVSRKALEWGQRNFALNEQTLGAAQPAPSHRFIRSDAIEFFGRARRQGRVYDMALLDPPAFGRDKQTGRAFSLQENLEPLLAAAVERLAPGGRLVLTVNLRSLPTPRIRAALLHAAQGRAMRELREVDPPPDFAGDPAYRREFRMTLG